MSETTVPQNRRRRSRMTAATFQDVIGLALEREKVYNTTPQKDVDKRRAKNKIARKSRAKNRR